MKKRNSNSVILLFFCLFLSFSCSKESGIPDSLEEIWNRNEVDNSGSGSAGTGAGGGAPSRYGGASASTVNQLLSMVAGWKTPSCANCNDGIPPDVDINPNCMRDIYVSAAVAFAWAAESYYRLGNTTRASELVAKMNESLQAARNLCGPSTINLGSCLTLLIYPC